MKRTSNIELPTLNSQGGKQAVITFYQNVNVLGRWVLTVERLKLILLTVLILSLACSSPNGPDDIAGTGSKVGNAFTGTVYKTTGEPAAGALVSLIPADFNPALDNSNALVVDTADSEGYYEFTEIAVDSASDGKTKLFISETVIDSAETVVINDTLGNIYTVRGNIQQDPGIQVLSRAVIIGATYLDSVDSAGSFIFTEIPAGTYTIDVVVDSVIENEPNNPVNVNDLYVPLSVLIKPRTFIDTVLILDTVQINYE
jgi:hypothetical protein